jgi:spore germination cell wall hydrolase CwlJ-like protein
MATAAQVPAQPTGAQYLALMQRYGPNTGAALQRSQYLADALQALEAGARTNIRTPLALVSNLLADGILNWSKAKAERDLPGAYQRDIDDQDRRLMAGTPLDPNMPAAAAAAPPAAALADAAPAAPPPQNLPSAPAPAAAAPAAAAPSTAPQASAGDVDALTRMMLGEAGGEGDRGMNAVGAVALNRLHRGGYGSGLSAIIHAPHQFPGVDTANANVPATSPAYQHAQALANGLLGGGVPDPTNGAVNYLNPDLMTQMGKALPSWAQGPGQRLGRHVFFGGSPEAAALAQNGAQPGPPPPQVPNGATTQAAAPYQVASVGATPPPPQAAPPPASPPAGAAPPAPSSASPVGAPAGGASSGPPLNFVTPQEWQAAASLLHNPQTRDLGVQEFLKLKMRAASAIEPPKNMYWDPASNRFQPVPGTQYTQLAGASPSDAAQRDPFGQVTHQAIPGVQGAVPEGKVYNPATRSYQAIAGGEPRPLTPDERHAWGIADNDRSVYALGADGKPFKVADAAFSVKDAGQLMQDLTSSTQYDKAVKLTELYRGAVLAAQRPGGMSDAELKDNAAQIFSGGVARQFNSKMIEEGQGPWLRLKQFAPNIVSGQQLSPQARAAILEAMHDYVTEAQTAFRGLAASKGAFAAQQGVDIGPFTAPLLQNIPDLPPLSAIPSGMGGYPGGAAPQSPNVAPGRNRGPGPGMGFSAGPAPVPVRTPEEARKLPRGTIIRLPDGSIGRVP